MPSVVLGVSDDVFSSGLNTRTIFFKPSSLDFCSNGQSGCVWTHSLSGKPANSNKRIPYSQYTERERERDLNSENSAFCSKSSPPYVPRVLYFLVSSESCVKLPILFSPPHAGIFFERNTPIPHFRSIHKV